MLSKFGLVQATFSRLEFPSPETKSWDIRITQWRPSNLPTFSGRGLQCLRLINRFMGANSWGFDPDRHDRPPPPARPPPPPGAPPPPPWVWPSRACAVRVTTTGNRRGFGGSWVWELGRSLKFAYWVWVMRWSIHWVSPRKLGLLGQV